MNFEENIFICTFTRAEELRTLFKARLLKKYMGSANNLTGNNCNLPSGCVPVSRFSHMQADHLKVEDTDCFALVFSFVFKFL